MSNQGSKKFAGYSSKSYANKVAKRLEARDGKDRVTGPSPTGGFKVYFKVYFKDTYKGGAY